MSYSVFLQRFRGGELARVDSARLWELLQPWVVNYDINIPFVGICAPDGGKADVYGASPDHSDGCMFTHFSPGDITNLMVNLAHELDLVLMPQDHPVLLIRETQRKHLPEDLAPDAIVIETGPDLDEALI